MIGNTGWLFLDRMVRMGVGLLVGVWVARYLGPEQFGILNYAMAFVALFASVASMGLDNIVVRDIVHDPAHADRILGSAFLLRVSGGVFTIAASLLAISVVRRQDTDIIAIVGIIAAGVLFQAFDTIDSWFQAHVQSKYTVLAKNTAFLLLAMVKIFLIYTRAPLLYFAWTVLLEAVAGSVGLIIAYRISGHSLQSWRATVPHAKRLLSQSWPLMLSGLAIMIYVKIGQIMLGELSGNASVGIYSAATKISEIWYFIPVAIASSISPSIIRAKRESEALYYRQLQRSFDIVVLLAYGIAIPMTFLSTDLVLFLYGEQYRDGGMVLTIHIWAGLFVFLGVVRGVWIIAEGATKLALITTASGAGVNVLLNWYLIPRHGAVGAAIAAVISYGFSDYFLFLLSPRLRQIGNLMTNSLLLHFIYRER
ncbi:MAG: O-unit flippase [Lentisphaerae bacterium RIFOXYB12_FULL_65_16]|nr:MAG: O-unit flippase [Lentisphaerae bacterium RIFOXYA12_64_32]OGV87105.1 MAG: O-unit flippase [Lentisphaerae bacterium RIFOXYB12_FULL_65_16]